MKSERAISWRRVAQMVCSYFIALYEFRRMTSRACADEREKLHGLCCRGVTPTEQYNTTVLVSLSLSLVSTYTGT